MGGVRSLIKDKVADSLLTKAFRPPIVWFMSLSLPALTSLLPRFISLSLSLSPHIALGLRTRCLKVELKHSLLLCSLPTVTVRQTTNNVHVVVSR